MSASSAKKKAAPYHRNGFSRPLVLEQYFTWAILSLQFFVFFSLVVPFLNPTLSYCSIGLYSASSLAALGCFLYVSLIDPVQDDYLLDDKKERFEKMVSNKATPLCTRCEIAMDINSKHCWDCHKCVAFFDHHCKYLNTCVGKKNYRVFLALISTIFAASVYHTVLLIYIFAHLKESLLIDSIKNSVLKKEWVYLLLLGVSAIPVTVSLFGFGTLLLFHIYINFHKMTTYQYIIDRRKRKMERRERKAGKRTEKIDMKAEERKSAIRKDWIRDKTEREKRKMEEERRLEGGGGEGCCLG